jgi:hypothetical protein
MVRAPTHIPYLLLSVDLVVLVVTRGRTVVEIGLVIPSWSLLLLLMGRLLGLLLGCYRVVGPWDG